jgi:hypothetical protein
MVLCSLLFFDMHANELLFKPQFSCFTVVLICVVQSNLSSHQLPNFLVFLFTSSKFLTNNMSSYLKQPSLQEAICKLKDVLYDIYDEEDRNDLIAKIKNKQQELCLLFSSGPEDNSKIKREFILNFIHFQNIHKVIRSYSNICDNNPDYLMLFICCSVLPSNWSECRDDILIHLLPKVDLSKLDEDFIQKWSLL